MIGLWKSLTVKEISLQNIAIRSLSHSLISVITVGKCAVAQCIALLDFAPHT